MRSLVSKGIFVLAISLGFPLSASAGPVTWTLQNVVFFDTVATASGSFVYDADTNLMSAVNIVVSPGHGVLCSDPPTCSSFAVVVNAFPGKTYDLGFAVAADLFITLQASSLPDLTGDTIFQMLLTAPLTNAGGTVNLVPGAWGEYFCLSAACDSFSLSTTTLRTMTGAVSSVPEPATLVLLGTGLLGLAARRRRAHRASGR